MSAISAVKPPRKVVIAIDPSTDEGQHTADWAIDNVLDPSRDQLEIVSAISLDSEFDATELGKAWVTWVAWLGNTAHLLRENWKSAIL